MFIQFHKTKKTLTINIIKQVIFLPGFKEYGIKTKAAVKENVYGKRAIYWEIQSPREIGELI